MFILSFLVGLWSGMQPSFEGCLRAWDIGSYVPLIPL